MNSADTLLREAFDPTAFRRDGARMLEALAGQLERELRAESGAVLPFRQPRAMLDAWHHEFTSAASDPSAALADITDRMLGDVTQLHHRGFVAHQVAPPLPLAAVCDFAASFLNNGMAVYEMGQAGTAMEMHVIRWMCTVLGLGDQSGGVLTSGGTLATLTAMLAMRQARAGWDVWTDGSSGGPMPAVLVSEQAHYCADRAARIMGWGAGGVIRVPVDARYRMRADALERCLAEATDAGRRVIGVVASACSTATGSFDPIPAIADFCETHGLWLHVDGAHGAALALSSSHRHLLAGIDRADSVVWDAHKMLLQPALITAVLFRDQRHSACAFSQEASYLLAPDADDSWLDLAGRTFECTKRSMSFKLYATLATYGPALFDAYVTRTVDLARHFGAMLQAQPDFELAVEPECNIVCFRYRPTDRNKTTDELDALQLRIRTGVIARGAFYPVKARLRNQTWLRTTLMGPFTSPADLQHLLDEIREAAATV